MISSIPTTTGGKRQGSLAEGIFQSHVSSTIQGTHATLPSTNFDHDDDASENLHHMKLKITTKEGICAASCNIRIKTSNRLSLLEHSAATVIAGAVPTPPDVSVPLQARSVSKS